MSRCANMPLADEVFHKPDILIVASAHCFPTFSNPHAVTNAVSAAADRAETVALLHSNKT